MNDRLTEQKHESLYSTSVAIFTVGGVVGVGVGVACVVWPVVVAGGCYCCWVARPGGAGPLVRGRQPEPGRSQSHLQQLSLLTLPTPPHHPARTSHQPHWHGQGRKPPNLNKPSKCRQVLQCNSTPDVSKHVISWPGSYTHSALPLPPPATSRTHSTWTLHWREPQIETQIW